MQAGTLAAIWRYPVKALRAEPLAAAAILADGLEGDRTAALVVQTPDHARAGKPFRGKESPRLHLTADPQTAIAEAAGARVGIALDRTQPRWFDARPVSVLFDLWVRDVEALVGDALDPLRWRPNLFVTAAPSFALREPQLVGAALQCGAVALRVVDTIDRCVTPNYDVVTGESDARVLREVAQQRGNVVGVYCEVVTPGTVRAGDAVTLG